MGTLPSSFASYTDKYFLRSLEILQKEALNPFVHAQIFIRKGPGRVFGVNEVVASINSVKRKSLTVYSLSEGSQYVPEEAIMVIEGRAQDVIPLETVVLGIISAETTKVNDKTILNTQQIKKRVKEVVEMAEGRDVIYFGARHWRYDMDAEISTAAFAGGAINASTDIGAAISGKEGVGTIPHSLECIFAWKYGMHRAVVESALAFDRHIDSSVLRIALVDFANKEIDDSLAVARALGKKLYGIRIDTCGENIMQGSGAFKEHKNEKYWHGQGVTIAGTYQVRIKLSEAGFSNVKIMLSSGFGDARKVKAFVDAEKELGVQLFDSLGIGQLFPMRAATMDLVSIGEEQNRLRQISKVGRYARSSTRLQKFI